MNNLLVVVDKARNRANNSKLKSKVIQREPRLVKKEHRGLIASRRWTHGESWRSRRDRSRCRYRQRWIHVSTLALEVWKEMPLPFILDSAKGHSFGGGNSRKRPGALLRYQRANDGAAC